MSSARHGQSYTAAPNSFTYFRKLSNTVVVVKETKNMNGICGSQVAQNTCARERQSMLALPTKKCLPSTTHNLVCKIPVPINRLKSKLRTMAAPMESRARVSSSGADLEGWFWAMRMRMPRSRPASFNRSNTSSPFPKEKEKTNTCHQSIKYHDNQAVVYLPSCGIRHYVFSFQRPVEWGYVNRMLCQLDQVEPAVENGGLDGPVGENQSFWDTLHQSDSKFWECNEQ